MLGLACPEGLPPLDLAATGRWGVSQVDPPSTDLARTARSPCSPPLLKAPLSNQLAPVDLWH